MSRIHFELSGVEHQKSFITSGPVCFDFQADSHAGRFENIFMHKLICGDKWKPLLKPLPLKLVAVMRSKPVILLLLVHRSLLLRMPK